jgi:hypothetical protein
MSCGRGGSQPISKREQRTDPAPICVRRNDQGDGSSGRPDTAVEAEQALDARLREPLKTDPPSLAFFAAAGSSRMWDENFEQFGAINAAFGQSQ